MTPSFAPVCSHAFRFDGQHFGSSSSMFGIPSCAAALKWATCPAAFHRGHAPEQRFLCLAISVSFRFEIVQIDEFNINHGDQISAATVLGFRRYHRARLSLRRNRWPRHFRQGYPQLRQRNNAAPKVRQKSLIQSASHCPQSSAHCPATHRANDIQFCQK